MDILKISNRPDLILSLDTGGDEDGDTKPGLALPETEAEAQH